MDRLGDLHEAFEIAKRRAGLKTAKLVKYHRYLEYVGSPYASAPGPQPATSQFNLVQVNLALNPLSDTVGFYYLWDPAAW